MSEMNPKETVLIKIQKWIYRLTRFGVHCIFPKYTIEGAEKLPKVPCIIIANHSQMNGPIVSQLYMPRRTFCWCNGELMNLKEVPAYAYADFWSEKPKSVKWFYKILSYIIAPLAVCVFNHADTIGVYRDTRIIQAFRESVTHLKEGHDVIIFPEEHVPYNQIVNQFQSGFVDVAKQYTKTTGSPIAFVPAYIVPAYHKIIFGDPIPFDAGASIKTERQRIVNLLMTAITEIAVSLPRHRVMPYTNMRKSDYPWSKEKE